MAAPACRLSCRCCTEQSGRHPCSVDRRSVKEPCALEALAVADAWAGGGSVQRVLVRFYIQVNRAPGAAMAAQPLQLPIGRGLQVLISRSTHSLT